MLHARFVPPVPADTEFADMRAAYDALPEEMKAQLDGLRVHHSIAHSRQTLGFEFSPAEHESLKGAVHPLVRTLPRARRRSPCCPTECGARALAARSGTPVSFLPFI
jgi:alpha-ketoglutarate-dependent 2,4-dichlorophenoxyacetate dioxygenase